MELRDQVALLKRGSVSLVSEDELAKKLASGRKLRGNYCLSRGTGADKIVQNPVRHRLGPLNHKIALSGKEIHRVSKPMSRSKIWLGFRSHLATL